MKKKKTLQSYLAVKFKMENDLGTLECIYIGYFFSFSDAML